MVYECTFICSPELDAAKVEEVISKVTKVVETSKGSIKNLQQLGKKKLAYNIEKFREGIYVYMELEGCGTMLSALENFFNVNDSVIRFLTVKVDVKKKLAAAKARKAAEKRAADAAAKAAAEQAAAETKTEPENESGKLSDTAAK